MKERKRKYSPCAFFVLCLRGTMKCVGVPSPY
nr:MAG TPA: Elicitor peptide 1-7 [Bacteriophage sp.]